MRNTAIIFSGSILMATGCASDTADSDLLVEDSAMMSALTQGEGEDLGGTPTGDDDEAASEDANSVVRTRLESWTTARDCIAWSARVELGSTELTEPADVAENGPK